MPLTKHTNFAFNHSDQPNDLYNVETSAQIKSNFDSRAQELEDTLSAVIDQLQSIADSDSGADNIGATAITGLTGTTVQALLEALKSNDDSILNQINNVVLGQIPDGTITDVKLSNNPADIKQSFITHEADYLQYKLNLARLSSMGGMN